MEITCISVILSNTDDAHVHTITKRNILILPSNYIRTAQALCYRFVFTCIISNYDRLKKKYPRLLGLGQFCVY